MEPEYRTEGFKDRSKNAVNTGLQEEEKKRVLGLEATAKEEVEQKQDTESLTPPKRPSEQTEKKVQVCSNIPEL